LRFARPSQTTFFGNNCKILVTIFVNSFAFFYFAKIRPFNLPLNQRMLSLTFLKSKSSGDEFNE